MRLRGQELDLPPVQELMQGGEGVLGDGTLVHIAPYLQSHQGNADIQSPVELREKGSETCVQIKGVSSVSLTDSVLYTLLIKGAVSTRS